MSADTKPKRKRNRKPKRPLPGLAKCGTGLWTFSYGYGEYFVSKDATGWWWVVARGDESVTVGWGGRQRETAVRVALNVIDKQHQDQGEAAA